MIDELSDHLKQVFFLLQLKKADSNGIAFGAEKFVTDDTKVGIGYA